MRKGTLFEAPCRTRMRACFGRIVPICRYLAVLFWKSRTSDLQAGYVDVAFLLEQVQTSKGSCGLKNFCRLVALVSSDEQIGNPSARDRTFDCVILWNWSPVGNGFVLLRPFVDGRFCELGLCPKNVSLCWVFVLRHVVIQLTVKSFMSPCT